MANNFYNKFKKSKKKLSNQMQDAISRGIKYSAKDYAEARDFMTRSYDSYKEVFEDYHGVIYPSSTGVADKGLSNTGSPEFCTVWSFMGTPSLLPLLQGENNLPLGVQLIGNKYDDLRFMGIANWLEKESSKFNSRITTIIGLGFAIFFLVGLATTLTRSMLITALDVLPYIFLWVQQS